VAGGKRDADQHNRHTRKGGQIVRRHAEEQAGHEMRNNMRANQAYARANGGQTEPCRKTILRTADHAFRVAHNPTRIPFRELT
jgi:hypothetical protein